MSDTTSGGFMANLMDPTTMGLLGAAQGFAQAAMPTRMPIPFGAAIGMGAGGLGQGLKNAYALQLEQQQAKAADIANQRAMLLLNWYKGMPGQQDGTQGGAPFGAPAAPQSGGGAPATDANGRYLVPPPMLRSMGDLSLMAGDPRAAAAFYGQVQTGAGGPGYAMGPNGVAFATPGGAKDPGTIYTNSRMEAGGKLGPDLAAKGWQIGANGQLQPIAGGMADPAYQATLPRVLRPGGMLIANGQTVKNPELIKTVDPHSGAVQYAWANPPEPTGIPGAAANGQSPADPFPAWGQRINQAENGTGNPAAKNPNSTATGNGQFIDQTWMDTVRAVRPDLASSMTPQQILELRKNPQISLQMTTAYARQNAAILAQNHLPITAGTVSLAQALGPSGAVKLLQANPNTPLQMLLPQNVIAANPQFQGNRTAGDAIMWAQQRMGTPAPQAPANDGTARPMLGPNGQPAMAEVAPQVQESRDAAYKEYVTKDSDAYTAAQNTLAWIKQMDSAAEQMTQAGPLFMGGPHAEARYSAMASVNDMLRSFGAKPLFNQQAVASWEELRKATTTAGFELSSHYEGRARQAASVIENATSAVPGDHNSPIGFQLVKAGIQAGAQWNIDLHDYKTQLYQSGQADKLVTADDDFYKAHPPQMYAERAISTVHPVHITSPDQFKNYLPGTYATLPNGKLIQVPMRPGAPGVPSYLQQQAAPTQAASAPPVPMPPPGNDGGANG